MSSIGEQPVPRQARCPECRGEPLDARHNLSALGYHHDDQQLTCADCGYKWTLGVPAGVADEYLWHDLICRSCDGVGPQTLLGRLRHRFHEWVGADCNCCDRSWARVHRVRFPDPDKRVAGLFLKCPNCYHCWTVRRVVGATNQSIVGWPMTTGELGDGHGWTVDGAIRPNEDPPDRVRVSESATVTFSLDDLPDDALPEAD